MYQALFDTSLCSAWTYLVLLLFYGQHGALLKAGKVNLVVLSYFIRQVNTISLLRQIPDRKERVYFDS